MRYVFISVFTTTLLGIVILVSILWFFESRPKTHPTRDVYVPLTRDEAQGVMEACIKIMHQWPTNDPQNWTVDRDGNCQHTPL